MENVSNSRSRSLGRQRDSSQERHRAPSGERQRAPSAERQRTSSAERQRTSSAERQRTSSAERQRTSSAERQRTSSAERRVPNNERRHEKQSASFYNGGMLGPPGTAKSGNPVSSYLQQQNTGEQDLLLSQGQESSRRYATFLMQDGLLSSDLENFNPPYNNRCMTNADKSSSQTSVRLESPNDEIAAERLGIPKRRPATTPAALFHLPSSKSHHGPGIACNFDINMGPPTTVLSKPSTTSLDEEVAVFQNGLNDVTHQLELIQTTQGSILKELADDIEALQTENTYLRESRNRLQCANDNLLKVVQDLTKELSALKKCIDPPSSSSNKNLVSNKTPQDILKGLETILKASGTSLCPSEQKSSSKAHQKGSSRVSGNSNKVKAHVPAAKKPTHSNKTSYSRDDGASRSNKSHRSSQHNLENQRRSISSHQMKIQNDEINDEEETQIPVSTPRRQQQRRSENDRQDEYEDDSDSDEEYYANKKEQRKKKKNGCFSFGRKRSSRGRDRDRDRNRRRD